MSVITVAKGNTQKLILLLKVTVVFTIFVGYCIITGGHFCKLKNSTNIKVNQSQFLLDLIRKERIVIPLEVPYNTSALISDSISVFNAPDAFASYIADINSFWIDALIAVETFTLKKKRRYFVEINAGDGVTNSGTLHLEKFLNWTGVLIEENTTLFRSLKYLQRKSFVINACVSICHIQSASMRRTVKEGISTLNCQTFAEPKHSTEIENRKKKQKEEKCLSLSSILFETNITSIDLFILKKSTFHLEVLLTIPFEKLEISFFAVEVSGLAEESLIPLHMFLASKGYIFYDKFITKDIDFSMFIMKIYYLDEDIITKTRKMSPLSYLKILTGSVEAHIDDQLLNQFILSNYFYLLQSQ